MNPLPQLIDKVKDSYSAVVDYVYFQNVPLISNLAGLFRSAPNDYSPMEFYRNRKTYGLGRALLLKGAPWSTDHALRTEDMDETGIHDRNIATICHE